MKKSQIYKMKVVLRSQINRKNKVIKKLCKLFVAIIYDFNLILCYFLLTILNTLQNHLCYKHLFILRKVLKQIFGFYRVLEPCTKRLLEVVI